MKKGIKIWKKRMCGVTTRIRLSPEIEQTTISVACSFNHGREGKPTAATPHRSKAYPPSHPGFWQWGAAVLCFAMLGACSDEIASLPDADVTGKEVEVSLNLDVMGNTDIVTRADVAASEADERKIVNIVPIVFDSNNKLAYMATVLSHDADNKTLTLKMRPSASATDKQRVVLLVNYYKASGTLYGGTDVNTDKGKNYDTWRNSLELKAGTTVVDIPHRGVPMWGESAAFSVKAGSSDQTVQLMRALARIDIGLRFTRGSDGNYTSDVEGVPGYTLSDVAVYYDSSYGTLIPLAANVANHIVTAPTVPAETDVDAAHTYTVTGNKLVRSIYVGEQPAGGFKGDGTNAFTLIAGITNQGIKSYYRINLTKQNDESTLLDILRNHRYVLNIQNITGKGWTTVDDALKSKPANIEWTCDVEDYNQGTYVSGNYYFQIDKWTTVGGNAGNYKSLKFKTNLPSLKVLTFTWDNAASAADATTVFKTPELRDTARTVAGIATGVLRIEAQTTNTTGDPRGTYVIDVSQTAPIDAFTINVMQDRGRAHYDMTAVEPKGLYLPVAYYGNGSVRKRYPMLKDVHYLLVTLRTLDSEDLNNTNATWTIKSVKPVNGYQFGGTGYFKDATVVSTATEHYTYTDVDGKPQSASLKVRYLQVKVPAVAPADVKNPAAGTYPLVGGYNYFDLTSDGTDLGNSGNPSEYKSVRIKVGYDTKSILMYSWYRGTYGYSTESGGSKAMLKAAVNYSLAGTVPVEGFTKKLVAVTEGLATQMPVTHGVPAAVAATTPPDIVILGLDNRFGSDAGTVMCNYINKGGVVILLSDGYYTASLKDNVAYIASRVVSNSTATTKLTSAANGGVGAIYDGGAGSIYPFLSTGDNAPAADDPILNGPFGNLRDKQWGEDGSATGFVKGITASDPVIVYSRDTKSRNNAGTDRGVSMFRSANKGFFFVGDGGFLSQASRSVGTNAIEPFAITATGQPTTRNYGYGYAAVVYNACLFANVMYWAIDYAQFYGPNSTTKAVGDYAPWFQ